MGADIAKDRQLTFDKSVMRCQRDLLNPGLFDPSIGRRRRTFLFRADPGTSISEGDTIVVRLAGDDVLLERNGRRIGVNREVSEVLREALAAEEVPAATAVVDAFDPVVGTVDVVIDAKGGAAGEEE